MIHSAAAPNTAGGANFQANPSPISFQLIECRFQFGVDFEQAAVLCGQRIGVHFQNLARKARETHECACVSRVLGRAALISLRWGGNRSMLSSPWTTWTSVGMPAISLRGGACSLASNALICCSGARSRTASMRRDRVWRIPTRRGSSSAAECPAPGAAAWHGGTREAPNGKA